MLTLHKLLIKYPGPSRQVARAVAWARGRWGQLGLARRLMLVFVGLVLVMQAVVYWAVHAALTEQGQDQLGQQLHTSERVLQALLNQEAERLQSSVSLLAANHGFRVALARGDVKAMQTGLELEGRRLGAQITAVLSPDLRLTVTHPLDELFMLWLHDSAYPGMQRLERGNARRDAGVPGAAMLEAVAGVAAQNRQRNVVALLGPAPYQFVVAPATDAVTNRVLGWVMMGFPLRQSLVDGLHDLLHVEVAVLAEPQDGVASVVLSTLGAAHNGVLAQHAGQETQLVLGEDTYAVHPLVLPVTGGQMRTLLLRSVTEAYAPFSRLQAWMAGIGVLGLGGFVWATAHSARRITQPLRALHSAAQALERGAFDRPLPPVTGHDEVAELTRGFDAMRLGLANQQAEIRRLAHRDRLTGLPNRQRFVEALEHAIQQAQGTEQTLVVATLNLNRFKHVNAVMGYGFGDQLLKAVGARLAQGLQQPPQLLARLGGDEFGLMLPGVGAADGEKLVAGLIEVLGQGITLNGQPVDVRVGAGWAIYPQDADSADTLVNRSEMAMRWAKNRLLGVLRYAPGHDTAGPETLTLLGDLRDGMRRGELRLYLQPKWSLDSGRPEAAEALVRWQHPVHGLLPPSRFIPFAEQTGFVCEITRWVLDAAVAACAGWQSECPGCSVAVNVSARDLQSVGFVEHVRSTLQRHNLPARQLELEITESAIMEDTEGALAALNSLSATGVGLSIDDYGTGYSSLSYVRRLPVQTLKIDQAFVRELLINNSDRVIVQSTIDLAHNLGLDVVAEGVECGKTLDLLGRMGCDVVQGYHISRPMPADAFVAWCHSLSAETDGVLT